MTTAYVIENMNPVIGPKKGNTQTIGVHDWQTGNRRTIETTPEKVDEFVNSRAQTLKSQNKNAILGAIPGLLLGTIGAAKANKDLKTMFGVFGAMLSFVGAIGTAQVARSIADKKITQEFIEENK